MSRNHFMAPRPLQKTFSFDSVWMSIHQGSSSIALEIHARMQYKNPLHGSVSAGKPIEQKCRPEKLDLESGLFAYTADAQRLSGQRQRKTFIDILHFLEGVCLPSHWFTMKQRTYFHRCLPSTSWSSYLKKMRKKSFYFRRRLLPDTSTKTIDSLRSVSNSFTN